MNLNIQFVILGGQKCSSTFIQHNLNEHPELFLPDGEIPYFENSHYNTGELKKLKLNIESHANKIIGIKRPSYLTNPNVPIRIKNDLKQPKFISILRNPLERLVSAYFHNMNYGFLPILELNKGINNLLSGKYHNTKYHRSQKELISFGFYYKGLSRYFECFKKDSFLILFHDDLKTNSLELIKNCYSFLGVESSFTPRDSINKRPQKVNYSIIRTKWLNQRNRFLYRYYDNRSYLEEKTVTKTGRLNLKILNGIDRFLIQPLYSSNDKPTLSKENRQRLLEIYSEDIVGLEKETGRDLTHWKS